MNGYSARYDAALQFAARAHRAQLRKGTDLPYIAHPVHVSIILIRHGFAEDLAIAGLLHDVLEDCDVAPEELGAAFGPRVLALVESVSEQKRTGAAELPWEQRKAANLEHLRLADADSAALKAADAIHNASSIVADLHRDGPAIWGRFKRGAAPTLGYYRAIGALVQQKLGDHPIAAELALAIADLAAIAEGGPPAPATKD